jgi:sulfane dehydrogenase subunit SoxC
MEQKRANQYFPTVGDGSGLTPTDIPAVNADQWRLKIAGQVATPLDLTLEEIKKRPRRTLPVTMECAGNGRALFAPRRISQPWLLEAIGNAEWTGTPLRSILQEAGVSNDAMEIVFTGFWIKVSKATRFNTTSTV